MPESCFPQLPLATCTGNPPGTTSKIQVASRPWTPGAHVAMNQASNSAIHCRRRWRADGGIQWRAIGSGTAQSTADPDMSLPRDRTRWRFPTRLSPIWQVAARLAAADRTTASLVRPSCAAARRATEQTQCHVLQVRPLWKAVGLSRRDFVEAPRQSGTGWLKPHASNITMPTQASRAGGAEDQRPRNTNTQAKTNTIGSEN